MVSFGVAPVLLFWPLMRSMNHKWLVDLNHLNDAQHFGFPISITLPFQCGPFFEGAFLFLWMLELDPKGPQPCWGPQDTHWTAPRPPILVEGGPLFLRGLGSQGHHALVVSLPDLWGGGGGGDCLFFLPRAYLFLTRKACLPFGHICVCSQNVPTLWAVVSFLGDGFGQLEASR